MNKIWSLFAIILLGSLAAHGQSAAPGDAADVSLSAPQTDGGMPLFQALKERKSVKEFAKQPLSAGVLSSLLWAAYGINRPESGRRTAPSAKNKQEVRVYAFTTEGTYLYEAAGHKLKRVAGAALPLSEASNPSEGSPPLELVYVADFAQSAGKTDEEKRLYASITAGCIIQNVYLFCASEKLATVTRVIRNGDSLAKTLGLTKEQWPIMTQAVGFPAK